MFRGLCLDVLVLMLFITSGFPQSLKTWILGFPWKLEKEFVLEKSLNLGDPL